MRLFIIASSGFAISLINWLACLQLFESRLLARDLIFLGRRRAACPNMEGVISMNAAFALLTAAAVVVAPIVAALATGHRGVNMILMMALVIMIVRLIVVRICAAFFSRVLARAGPCRLGCQSDRTVAFLYGGCRGGHHGGHACHRSNILSRPWRRLLLLSR